VLQRTVEPIRILLVELLEVLPVRASPEAAHALLSCLLGTLFQQRVRQVPFEVLRADIAALLRLEDSNANSSDSSAMRAASRD